MRPSDSFVTLAIDPRTRARLNAEAGRRGTTLDKLVREAVEAWLARREWDGRERRRDRLSVLEATGTGPGEHDPEA